MHALPVQDVEERRSKYELIRNAPEFQALIRAFDLWCALWFWPGDKLNIAPLPAALLDPSPEVIEQVDSLKRSHGSYRFFHWELEFPDVYGGGKRGFDAVVGNPPWEIQKPNSKEFFSNLDPLYRGYGKTEAEAEQKKWFARLPQIEIDWFSERARLKALNNWVKNVGRPFGDYTRQKPDGEEEWIFAMGRYDASVDLHSRWRKLRAGRAGYADSRHPFNHQGSADLNTYKMFVETGYRLLRDNGRLGFIVPSGIYSDKGSRYLRKLLLDESRWEWLFAFENRDRIFDIHRSFKFVPVIVEKGSVTKVISTAFMRHSLADWEDGERFVLDYPRDRVERFSPTSSSILEIRDPRDAAALERLYSHGVTIGDSGTDGWHIRMSRDFHMGDDAGVFRSRFEFEQEGYLPDPYSYWQKLETGQIAIPFYQGVMIGPLCSVAASYSKGAGSRATWTDATTAADPIWPQHLMALRDAAERGRFKGPRIIFRRQARATDTRTVIATVIGDYPSGDSVTVLQTGRPGVASLCFLGGVFSSLSHDWSLRFRISGANVSGYYLSDSVLPPFSGEHSKALALTVARLCFPHARYAPYWLKLKDELDLSEQVWQRLFAVNPAERKRLQVMAEAQAAMVFGLTSSDFRRVVDECDHTVTNLSNKTFARELNPTGFWRVDKDLKPELRHTNLSLVALSDLESQGLETFLGLDNGVGWELPEKLRLADYDLGRDDRALVFQPVRTTFAEAARLDLPMENSPSESWNECVRQAAIIEGILDTYVPSNLDNDAPGNADDQMSLRLTD
ncbi:MAG TPA: hypothetical protein VGN17_24775 [Bryobacteraceae bacterium]